MSEPRTRSVPFLRPIFARVAPILPSSWSSDCPELGRGDHAHSRAHAAAAATKATPKRTRRGRVSRGFIDPERAPAKMLGHHGQPLYLRTGHRAPGPDAVHHLSARRRLR